MTTTTVENATRSVPTPLRCRVFHVDGPLDRRAAELAAGQHGYVTRRQLLAAGLSSRQIEGRLSSGRYVRVSQGLYTLGGTGRLFEARCTAAVLAYGSDTVLSHLTAARLLELKTPHSDTIELLMRGSGGRRRRGAQIHRTLDRLRVKPFYVGQLPVTSPAQTLVDIAALVTARELERAVDEVIARRLASAAIIENAARKQTRRSGVRDLIALLDARLSSTFTRTDAEELLLALVRQAGLPEPHCNHRLHGFEVDMFWPEAQLAVEFDSYQWHSTKSAFERDRRKDAVLRAHGIEVARVTWERMQGQPLSVIAELAGQLARRTTTVA